MLDSFGGQAGRPGRCPRGVPDLLQGGHRCLLNNGGSGPIHRAGVVGQRFGKCVRYAAGIIVVIGVAQKLQVFRANGM